MNRKMNVQEGATLSKRKLEEGNGINVIRCSYPTRKAWKPMHMQPMYRMNPFITVEGSGRARSNAYIAGGVEDVGADIFNRGLCLPSDNKMTPEQQDRVIEVIKRCFE